MAVGFVLIVTISGFEKQVSDSLDDIGLITGRWGIFGEYDLIAKIESDDDVALTRCIVEDVRTIEGITETRTLIGAQI